MEIFNFTIMNSLFKNIIIIAISVFCMISCQKDIDELAAVAPNEHIMTISAEFDSTRTYISDESNGIIKWSDDDQLKVIENSTSYSTTSSISVDDEGKAQFTVAFAVNNSASSYTYNAIFPASAVIEDAKINTEKVKVSVIDEQGPTETSFDPQADILVSKQIEFDSQPNELNMQFKRLVSIGKLTLENIPADRKIHQVIFIAGDEDILAGRNYVNATTGEVIRYGYNNSTNTITLNYSEPIATRDVYFTCNPFEMEEGEMFTVVAVCDGTTYTREVIIPDGRSLVFTEGNMSTFSVDMLSAIAEGNELSSQFNTPIIQWNMTKDDIMQEMSDREQLYSDDTTLIYRGTGVEEIIAYSFTDKMLDTSISYVSCDRISIADINQLFEEYENVNEYDGYFNKETSTFANVSIDGNYYCVGWTVCKEEERRLANNQIWYTNNSTTEPIEPLYNNSTTHFGAKLISNKYDSDNECWVITFDGDVTKIGNYVFEDCTTLTSITIPDSVTEISKGAFKNCSKLTSITIPDNVTDIGISAFYGCSSLTDIIIGSGVTSIGESAFSGCSKLTNVTIGNGVTSLGVSAFYKCSSLTSVTIPDSVTTIGVGCFAGCTNITEFNGKYAADGGRSLIIDNSLIAFAPVGITEYTIPNNITEIGFRTFYNCDELISVTIPESVEDIGNYIFEDCGKLKNVYCKAVTPPAAGYDMFKSVYSFNIYVYAESINAYKSTPRWKDYASKFASNGNIPNSLVTTIYYTTTNEKVINLNLPVVSNSYNNGIGEIVIYGELTHISNGVFTNCTTLKSVTIPDSVKIINYLAFDGCSSLTSITIPNGVTKIGESAFANCSSLTSVIIPDSVKSIDGYVFKGCNSVSVYINDLSAWCKIDFKMASANPLAYGAKLYLNNTELTEITIPSDITEIKQYAFYKFSSLIEITFHDSVTSIGSNAFSDCDSLTSITLSDSITTIGEEAFYNCDSLSSIAIPNSVISIGEGAFMSCDSLTSITIPDSVMLFGDKAFSYCDSLTSVTISDGVTTIGYDAFFECMNLTSVYCQASIPPTLLGTHTFMYLGSSLNYYYLGCTIYVPASSVEAYKTAEGWSDYANYIIGYDYENGVVE